MRVAKLFPAALVMAAVTLFLPGSADAQVRRAGPAVGRAVPRAAAPVRPIRPRVIAPYRSFGFYGYPYYRFGYPYYGYGGFSFGFYSGYPYGALGLGYGYPYGYAYPYLGGYYGYPYGAVGGAYAPSYGGVRIVGAPREAPVYVDGYYVGVVNDFDGTYQHINLTPGVHKIEIRPNGAPPISFDVQIQPGQTITYRADLLRN
jgi:hypothetical protein